MVQSPPAVAIVLALFYRVTAACLTETTYLDGCHDPSGQYDNHTTEGIQDPRVFKNRPQLSPRRSRFRQVFRRTSHV